MIQYSTGLFNRILNTGIHEGITFQEKKRLRLINQILFISSIIPLLYIVLFTILKFEELYTIEIVISLTSVAGYLIKHKNRFSIFILLVIIPLELLYFSVFVGNMGTEFFFFIFVIVGYYILSKKYYLILLTAFLTTVILISKYYQFNHQYPEEYKILETLCYYPNMLISLFLISLTTSMFKKDSVGYQNTIEEQKDELRIKVLELEKREKILSELLNELNNRVISNLQIISGLFTIHIYYSKNEEVILALRSARYRIDVISILYRHLHKKEGLIKPNLSEYIKELSQYMLQVSGNEDTVELKTKVDELYLKIETISHIGLLINELLTNTFKYGLKNEQDKNKVDIIIQKTGGTITIKVSDNGKGFAKDALIKEKDSFGMKLVHTIVQQYNGEVNTYNKNGAHTDIELNLEL